MYEGLLIGVEEVFLRRSLHSLNAASRLGLLLVDNAALVVVFALDVFFCATITFLVVIAFLLLTPDHA